MLKRIFPYLIFLMTLVLSILCFNRVIPIAKSYLPQQKLSSEESQALHYVAIGDSLTQGVGDTTNQGGFVPLLSQRLTSQYGHQVVSSNYGKSGNTSQQILKRMQENTDIQEDLAQADLMTLTVGGNDVMAVIRKELANLTLSSFTQPSQAYQQRLRQIIDLARQDNEDLPIYILGIYNPFYLNFPEITEMQTVIDNWNKATQAVVKEYDNVYFVPINDLLYMGLEGQEALEQESTVEESNSEDLSLFEDNQETSDATTSIAALNNLLSDDHFHPNNTGYQLMMNAVMEEILETKDNW